MVGYYSSLWDYLLGMINRDSNIHTEILKHMLTLTTSNDFFRHNYLLIGCVSIPLTKSHVDDTFDFVGHQKGLIFYCLFVAHVSMVLPTYALR